MTDDPGIVDQTFDVGVLKLRHLVKVKAGKSRAKILPFAKDGEPTQAGLESFEADLFERTNVIGDFPAPFVIVIAEIVLCLF